MKTKMTRTKQESAEVLCPLKDLKKRLQAQNNSMIVIPIENSVDFDLLVPKHKTSQYILREVDEYYTIHTISLSGENIIYIFDKAVSYLAEELIKSWSCSRRIFT